MPAPEVPPTRAWWKNWWAWVLIVFGLLTLGAVVTALDVWFGIDLTTGGFRLGG